MGRIAKLLDPKKWLGRLKLIIRFRSFDTSTEQGRKQERSRRIALSAASDGVSRLVSILVSLISVPLTLHYLGHERYGIWIAISSMVSMISIADLGLGNGLISALAKCSGKDDKSTAIKYVSSAFFGLLGIALAIGIVLIPAITVIPWGWLFNVSSPDVLIEARSAANAVTICFLLRFPLTVADRVRRALQEGYIASLLSICSSIASLIGLLIGIQMGIGLTGLVIILSGSPIIGSLINAWLIISRDHPHLVPRIQNFERLTTFSLLRVGWCFLGLQACTLIAFETDILVVSSVLGVGEVPQYSVPLRLFMFLPMVLAFVLRPLWPAYGEAYSRGDHRWVRQTLWRSILVSTVFAALGALFLGFFCNIILKIWIGDAFEIGQPQRLGLILFIPLTASIHAFTRYFQGVEAFRFLLVTSALMAAANLPISIILTQKLGVSGPIWGTVIARVVFSLIPMIYFCRNNPQGCSSRLLGN